MKRSIAQCIATCAVIFISCWNIWTLTLQVFKSAPRTASTNEEFDNLWKPLYIQLLNANYPFGDVGYITARTIRGEAPTDDDQVRRVFFYYSAIPLNVVADKLDAPFVIADFVVSGQPDHLPQDLEMVYDIGNGVALLKHRATK